MHRATDRSGANELAAKDMESPGVMGLREVREQKVLCQS